MCEKCRELGLTGPNDNKRFLLPDGAVSKITFDGEEFEFNSSSLVAGLNVDLNQPEEKQITVELRGAYSEAGLEALAGAVLQRLADNLGMPIMVTAMIVAKRFEGSSEELASASAPFGVGDLQYPSRQERQQPNFMDALLRLLKPGQGAQEA